MRTIPAISKGASIGWAVVLVLLAAAAYEAAIALERISMGSLPGQEAPVLTPILLLICGGRVLAQGFGH